jgi:hypothetical protein
MLIGDKSGPALIASTYGDLRDEHLLAQARRIQHHTGEHVSDIPSGIPACPQESPRTQKGELVSKVE